MDSDLPLLYPIVLYLVLILAFVAGTLLISHWIAPRRPHPVKDMPYESGMDPVGDARRHFDVKFYLVAILFLVFDVELLFLYPWAVSAYADLPEGNPLRGGILQDAVFVTMLVFLTTVALAYIYALRKGVFRWR
jgi:NADH:ubiquinone oxidoreductase subunit 3 (subunit A)